MAKIHGIFVQFLAKTAKKEKLPLKKQNDIEDLNDLGLCPLDRFFVLYVVLLEGH